MGHRRPNTTNKIEEQKFFRPPNTFQNSAKHPQTKHVEKNMSKTGMCKHVCEDLVGPEVLVIDRPKPKTPWSPHPESRQNKTGLLIKIQSLEKITH
jgi:hypothetical protein